MDADTAAAIAEADTIEPKGIEDVRRIVEGNSFINFYWGKKSDKLVVDLTTAGLICAVYDGVRGDLKKRINDDIKTSRESFTKLVNVCWKVASK
jgi:hypothetical protein